MGELADKLRYAMQDGTIRTEILGTAKLILEGCDGVIEYETEKIGLRCGRRAVWVEGKSLRLLCLEEDGAVITGHIRGGEVRMKKITHWVLGTATARVSGDTARFINIAVKTGLRPHSTSKGWERRAFHLVCEGLQKAA